LKFVSCDYRACGEYPIIRILTKKLRCRAAQTGEFPLFPPAKAR
jgi:hypothetical protein